MKPKTPAEKAEKRREKAEEQREKQLTGRVTSSIDRVTLLLDQSRSARNNLDYVELSLVWNILLSEVKGRGNDAVVNLHRFGSEREGRGFVK
jgi:hypothetical protein